jgi:hypothetical protein
MTHVFATEALNKNNRRWRCEAHSRAAEPAEAAIKNSQPRQGLNSHGRRKAAVLFSPCRGCDAEGALSAGSASLHRRLLLWHASGVETETRTIQSNS